ncbi:Uncharacterised protein [uncultured archaeon]|nr:Uncharacterised protein [uncultured archaeon]
MNTQTKLAIGLVGIVLLALGIGLSLSYKQPDPMPPWVHKVDWQNKPGDAARIEELLWTGISPYRTEYETVNISAGSGSSGLRLRVIATAKDSEYPDIYDFVYEGDKLLLTGYLLEAIPQEYRNEAIGLALGNQEIASSVIGSGTPSVKRVLPSTAEKFYAPKTLLSVTWEGTSALIDPDERKVANIWKAGAQDSQVRGGSK